MKTSGKAAPPTPENRAGAGDPVLLLHAFTLSHHCWHAVVDDLSADHDVLALTMPGHWGGPRLRTRDLGVGGLADGVERRLDQLGWGACHIAGNSLGGQVGFELERRGRARSLAAINPGGGWKHFSATEFGLGMTLMARFPRNAVARLLGDRAATDPRFQLPILRHCSRSIESVSPQDAADVVRGASHCPIYLPIQLAFLRDGPLANLDQVRAPTSLLMSEFDTFLPRETCMRRLIDELPEHAWRVELPGVGHVPMLENPQLVAQALRAHLTRAAERAS